MQLAHALVKVAHLIAGLHLFLCIENPVLSSIYKLFEYVRLHLRTGFFYVDLDLCMFNYRHSGTGELCKKGLKLLTNAPWMLSLGYKCNRKHVHTRLEESHVTESASCLLYTSDAADE